MRVQERMKNGLRGRWRDEIYSADGVLVSDSGWSDNQIQDTAATIVAGCLSRLDELPATWEGISYLALGEGQGAWDTAAPAQNKADTTLNNEQFRKAVLDSDIVFIDALGGAVSGAGVETRFIRCTVTIGVGEANGLSLREFGLFGGDAGAGANTGYIFNWVVHGRIDKDATMVIVRTIEVEVQLPT